MDGVPEQFDSPRDRAEFCRPAHRPGIELYRAHIVDCAFKPHGHDAYSIGVIDRGVERFRWRGSEHIAGTGTWVMMNPQDLHTGRAETAEGWSYRMLYLDEALLQDITGGAPWLFHQATTERPELTPQLSGLLQQLWQAASMNVPLAFDSALQQVVELIRPCAAGAAGVDQPSRSREPQRFARVLDFMRAHLAESLSTEQLAHVAHLSPFHFLRSFQAQHHATPQQMLMALRLLEAKRCLAAGQGVAGIATAVGLTDQAHLTRAFLQRYGVTPARYQQQVNARVNARHAQQNSKHVQDD